MLVMPRSASLIALSALLAGCANADGYLRSEVEAEVMAPPNGGRTQTGDHMRDFNPIQFDDVHTVEVGPPSATLVYWVATPTPERVARLRIPDWAQGRCVGPEGLAAPRGVAIVLSGWTRQSNRDGTWMPREYGALICQGWRVVAPDLRGFGDSTGDVASYGIYDRRDLKQLVDELGRRDLLNGPVIVIGHSYGASVALQYAAADPRVKAVVALSGQRNLLSIGPAVRAEAARSFPIVSSAFLGRLDDAMVRSAIEDASRKVGLDPAQSDSVTAARQLKIPYFVAHGGETMSCPSPMARRSPQPTLRIRHSG